MGEFSNLSGFCLFLAKYTTVYGMLLLTYHSQVIQEQGDYDMWLQHIGVLIPIIALSIPIVAITLSYKQKTQKNRIRELELQKEIFELEIEKQNSKAKLLEEENKKYDKIINGEISEKY